MISQLLTRKLRVLPIKSRLLRWRSLSLQQGKKSVISSTVLLPIFLVMTHSSTLYEKEVGAGLVVDSVKKKKLCDPFCSPRPDISNIKSKKTNKQTNKTKHFVPWKSTTGNVTKFRRLWCLPFTLRRSNFWPYRRKILLRFCSQIFGRLGV